MAYNLAQKLGPKAEVLVDTGHHAQGTNIEHIVAYLLDQKRLGGFHFNSRKYADDDLIAGAHNPYELFLIFLKFWTPAVILTRTSGRRPNIFRICLINAIILNRKYPLCCARS